MTRKHERPDAGTPGRTLEGTGKRRRPKYTAPTMPFGRFRGAPLTDLPIDYLLWLIEGKRRPLLRCPGLARALQDELQRRRVAATPMPDYVRELACRGGR